MVKIGIISTIPHTQISKYFTNKNVLEYIKQKFVEYKDKKNFKNSDITLVSNGYPWINHIPITLFLEELNTPNQYAHIEICVPTNINPKTMNFLNTHEGRALNELHKKYKENTSIDTLGEICSIFQNKTSNKIHVKRGFKQANTMMVRNCDHVLVFGFDDEPQTELWGKILCEKIYYKIVF